MTTPSTSGSFNDTTVTVSLNKNPLERNSAIFSFASAGLQQRRDTESKPAARYFFPLTSNDAETTEECLCDGCLLTCEHRSALRESFLSPASRPPNGFDVA